MSSYPVYLLFIYFSGRLFFYDIDIVILRKRASRNNIIKRILFGLLLFLFFNDFGVFTFQYFIYLLMIGTDIIPQPKRIGNGSYYLLQMLFITILFPSLAKILSNNFVLLQNPANILFLDSQRMLEKIIYVTSGYIITLKEGTLVIRLVLNRIRAVPQESANPSKNDEQEYERGRLIGILERTFIYFLVLFNQIGAIAVIIALKSLARFSELNKKDFAEYFLIGSLLSLLVATVPAVLVKFILNSL